MKKLLLTLSMFSVLGLAAPKHVITITPNVELGGDVFKLTDGSTSGAADIAASVEGKMQIDMKSELEKVETDSGTIISNDNKFGLELGLGLREAVQVMNKDSVYGSTIIYGLAEGSYKFNPNLSAHLVGRVGPGIAYGITRGAGWGTNPVSKVVLAAITDAEIGLEYKNIRGGLVLGGYFPVNFKNATSTAPQFKVGVKFGYDIDAIKF